MDFNIESILKNIDPEILDLNMDSLQTLYPEPYKEGREITHKILIEKGFDIEKIENDNILTIAESTNDTLISVCHNEIEEFLVNKYFPTYCSIVELRKVLIERNIKDDIIEKFFIDFPNTVRTLVTLSLENFKDDIENL